MPFTRPTTDIAREGLFNIIQNNLEIETLNTLDLFGGTGCITYELASRGARKLVIVEKNNIMTEFIKKTVLQLKLDNITIIKSDVFKYISTCNESFDFIFAGPPYALATIDEIPKLVFEKKILTPGGWLVLEHTPRNNYKKLDHFRSERNYGTTIFSIFIEHK